LETTYSIYPWFGLFGLVRIGIVLVAGLGDASDDELAAEYSHCLFDADAFGHSA
jgi:hypothetical protein